MLKILHILVVKPVAILMVVVLGVSLYLLSFLPRVLSGRYYHYLARLLCRFCVLVLGVDLKLVHANTQPLPDHYILIANHPSVLEDFAIPALFDIYPLAKEGVRDWFVLGRVSDYAGTIFVKRGDPDSRAAAREALIEATRSGKNPVVFPEGGCKGKDIYTGFKSGAFDASIQTGVPILPVYLHYHDAGTFEWTHQSMPAMLWQIICARDKRVEYIVHDAVYPEKFDDKEVFTAVMHQQYLDWQHRYRGI